MSCPWEPVAALWGNAMAAADVGNKRVAAGIFGIVLGALGIHKFIIGRTLAGIIMLVLTLVSMGFLAPIIALIGLIEGIIYLTKSNEEFYAMYIEGKRSWF